ncbi:MAG: SUF system NifU family Fe-S cluster assembly protein [Leptospiraceae bacterium]|nr:SUF system NifU family Fe-S cluster assembly protein [Leptospiraceae bacterium]
MEENLAKLYQGVIAEHNHTPLFFESRPSAGFVVEAYNPLCGDKFKLFLDIENGVVAKATFSGYGCAVSKAASSVLMKKIQGQSIEAVVEIIDQYLRAVSAGADALTSTDPETIAFTVAKNFPGRDKCATLSWKSLADFLDQRVSGVV